MDIYLARHGTTEWNSLHLIQGRTDILLDDNGTAMAAQSGEYFKSHDIVFDRVFSSPLKRAYETARLLAGDSASVITDNRLTELCFGSFEGRNVSEMQADAGCPFRFFKSDPFRYNQEVLPLAATESLDDLLARTADFINEVIVPLPGSDNIKNVLICGHGALNRALIMNFKGIRDLHEFWGTGLQPNCGINKISCTYNASGEVIYDVQDESLVLYDPEILSKTTALL